MARISTYDKDTNIHDEDLLAGSNYIGPSNYSTKNFKIKDLQEYFAQFSFQQGTTYNLATISQDIIVNASGVSSNTALITSLSSTVSTQGGQLTTNSNQIALKPSIFRQDDAPSTTGVANGSVWFDTNDNNKVYVLVSGAWAATPDVRIGTNITNIANNVTAINANSGNITTNLNNIAANLTSIGNNTSSITTNANNITANAGNISTNTNNIGTNASTAAANASSISANAANITSNVSALALRPRVYKQTSAPSTSSQPANSLWYDTDDNNKLYIFDGTNWVLTDDSRIGVNTTAIATANTSINTNATNITSSANKITELESQFQFSGTNITGVADALSTSISNTATSAAGAVASDLDKLEAVFSFDSNNNVNGIQGALSTATTTHANTAISNASLAAAADVTELQTQFTFSSGNITGVADTLQTSINAAQSNAESSSATKVDTLASKFFTGYNNANGTFTAISLSEAFANEVFQTTTDTTFATASSLQTLSSTVDTKPRIFRQDAQPTTSGVPANSLWYDTNDNNKLYVLVSSTWTATVDGTIATAQQSANNAQSTANGRPKVFRQTSAPSTSEPASSIWYDTDDDNKIYILVSGTWTATDDARIATNSASITSQGTTISRLDGHSKATYTLSASANDVVTGMKIIAANNSTSSVSEVKFQADKFIINSASSNLTPFSIDGGVIQINGQLNVNGTALIKGSSNSGQFIACDFKNTGSSGLSSIRVLNNTNYYGLFRLNTTVANDIGYYGIDLVIGPASGGGENRLVNFNGGGISLGSYGSGIFFNDAWLGGTTNNNSGGIRVRGSSDGQATQAMFITVPTNQASSTPAFAIEDNSSNSIFKVYKNGKAECAIIETSGNITGATLASNGTITATGAITSNSTVKGTQFIDKNDATYYLDPHSTSNLNAATFVGTISGQNQYLAQDLGIGFTSGNIGGRLHIERSSAGIGIKNDYGTAASGTTGLLGYTDASMNTSGAYHLVFQAAPTSGSDTNMLLCDLNGNLRNRNNSYGQYSDENLKENITPATDKLEDIKQLQVKNFNFIGDELKQIGLIAQEVEEVFPALVEDIETPQGNQVKSLKYSVLVPILLKAIQELEARVTELENN